jgi:hypothetical protein
MDGHFSRGYNAANEPRLSDRDRVSFLMARHRPCQPSKSSVPYRKARFPQMWIALTTPAIRRGMLGLLRIA